MKRSFTHIFSAILAFLFLMTAMPFAAAEEAAPLRIVSTIFPGYDFAKQLAGDHAQITILLPPGSDSHTFDPTPQDMLTVQNADLFIYNGGESDAWVLRMLDALGEDAPETFVMMDHSAPCEEDHDHAAHDHEHAADEHVWTSPKNVMSIADGLTEKLCLIRPSLADTFRAGNEAFQSELSLLDEALRQLAADGSGVTLVFGDRFPFRHLAQEYGFSYEAAFPGCSEDSEPGIKTITALVSLMKEENTPVVFHIEFSSTKTAQILAEETGAKMLLLHSCHTVSTEEIEAGATYLSLMWQNVDHLREALLCP